MGNSFDILLIFELLRHPPYLPDLTPNDFTQFPNQKKLSGLADKELKPTRTISEVNEYFGELDVSPYEQYTRCGSINSFVKMCANQW